MTVGLIYLNVFGVFVYIASLQREDGAQWTDLLESRCPPYIRHWSPPAGLCHQGEPSCVQEPPIMHCSSAHLGAELRGLGQPRAAFGLWVCAMTEMASGFHGLLPVRWYECCMHGRNSQFNCEYSRGVLVYFFYQDLVVLISHNFCLEGCSPQELPFQSIAFRAHAARMKFIPVEVF